ncbi:lipid-A-disaccharide synthase [Achromatium sp. WMS2]|nr:lipid-A-disaccharide synthase [Achromatium sp. WMS2]
MRIGIVANEPSGDQLGAGLITALKRLNRAITFTGVGGPQMQAAGCHSLIPMDHLSVMGLAEVILHIPRLLQIRRQLIQYFINNPPDVFIGIDAPDFNLPLELRLHQAGILTVHYVSPTIWAWRPQRVKILRKATDLVLSVFPFEEPILRQHHIAAEYIGHQLAELIPLGLPDKIAARQQLGLPNAKTVIAILPGSRTSEAKRLTPPFLQTAQWCLKHKPQLIFVIPVVNNNIRQIITDTYQQLGLQFPLHLVQENSHGVLSAADVVLTASGTATLEAMLHKRPMVVAYKINHITYKLVTALKLVKVQYIALANLLAAAPLAPEFIQKSCNPELLGPAILKFLDNPELIINIQNQYTQVHKQLHCNSQQKAAIAIMGLINTKNQH